MKDITTVGRRLRRYRLVAFLLFAVAIGLGAIGIAHYLNYGPPRRFVWSPINGAGHYEWIQPGDPYYQEIRGDQWSTLLYVLFWSAGFGAAGGLAFAAARKSPAKEVLILAHSRGGILTLGEVSMALDIDPRLAARALRVLQKVNLATPRWQEIRKNLWEFPDYMKLPIAESLEIAKSRGGHLRLEDLLASGHSADTARQTLDTLSEKGLAQAAPGAPEVIVTAQ